jgi:serine/threonine-protein kinase
MGDPQADIWVFDLARGLRTRLTFGGATHLEPSWSSDGQRIVYTRYSGPTLAMGTSLCARLASGGGQEEVLMQPSTSAPTLLAPQWSPDGHYLVHMETSGPTGASVWAAPTTGDKKPFPIVQAPTPQTRIVQFRLSPDGRWLAYSSTESGREEVYVTHFPSGAGKWQVSQNGATYPAWRGDSKEIYFTGSDDTSVHAVGVDKNTEEFQSQPGRVLFASSYIAPLGYPYDASPDGQRFVVNTATESVSTPLVLVTNWTADLKK